MMLNDVIKCLSWVTLFNDVILWSHKWRKDVVSHIKIAGMVQRRFFHCSVVSSSISTIYGAFWPSRRRADVRHRPTTTPLTESVEEFEVRVSTPFLFFAAYGTEGYRSSPANRRFDRLADVPGPGNSQGIRSIHPPKISRRPEIGPTTPTSGMGRRAMCLFRNFSSKPLPPRSRRGQFE